MTQCENDDFIKRAKTMKFYDTYNKERIQSHPLTPLLAGIGGFTHLKLSGLIATNDGFSGFIISFCYSHGIFEIGNVKGTAIETLLEYFGYTAEEIERNKPYYVNFHNGKYDITSKNNGLRMIRYCYIDDMLNMIKYVIDGKPHFGKNLSETKTMKGMLYCVHPDLASSRQTANHDESYVISVDKQRITIFNNVIGVDIFSLTINDLLKYFKFNNYEINNNLGKCTIEQFGSTTEDGRLNIFYIESEFNLVKPVVRFITPENILNASIFSITNERTQFPFNQIIIYSLKELLKTYKRENGQDWF